jgi:adenosylcobinamide-phosphate synthase
MSVALLCVAGWRWMRCWANPGAGIRWWRSAICRAHRATFQRGGRGWRSHGVTAWVIAVVPLTLLATALSWAPYIGWMVEILALYCALGMRSLGEHVSRWPGPAQR